MYCTLGLLIAGIVACTAQRVQDPLHGICHSNHLQQKEDQVIVHVIQAMNTNKDSVVGRDEILVFFADLMGLDLGPILTLLPTYTLQELLQVASGLKIERAAFVDAWHKRFHDSVPFVQATFDAFDVNADHFMDASEIEGIINTALATGDINQDAQLEESELILFLEKIYKNCD